MTRQSAYYTAELISLGLLLQFGLMQLFCTWRTKKTFQTIWASPKSKYTIFSIMIVLLFAPFVGPHLPGQLGKIMITIGDFRWGLIYVLFLGLLVISLIDLCVWIISKIRKRNPKYLTGSISVLSLTIIGIASAVYGYVAAMTPVIETLTLETTRLPRSISELKVVFVSDLHAGANFNAPSNQKLIQMIEAQEPDILLLGGDMFQIQNQSVATLISDLKTIQAPYGKFAVIGNHDVYAGIDRSVSMAQEAGFHVLRDEVLTINNTFNIAGIDDPADGSTEPEKEQKILSGRDPKLFTVFLKHEPDSLASSRELLDLQLGGHLHGGDFLFRGLMRGHHPQLEGYLPSTKTYISRGRGNSEPSFVRIGARPEILVIKISNKGN